MSLSFSPSSVFLLLDAETTVLTSGDFDEDYFVSALLVGRAFARFKREMDFYLERPDRVALGPVRKYRRLLDRALSDFQSAKQKRRPDSGGALR